MPSLMPGTPGAKEVYGIAAIREDLHIAIPPKALKHYELADHSPVVFMTTHRGEAGFALPNIEKAEFTVFGKTITQMDEAETIYWFQGKAYVMTHLRKVSLVLTPDLLQAFPLDRGERLLVVKGAAVLYFAEPIFLSNRL